MVSDKIKLLRHNLGLTQEELADRSGLSLRTVQRIENGDTEPRSDTLNRIAAALNVRTVNLKKDPLDVPEEDFTKRKRILHLSALSFWIFPFAGVMVPGIVWMVYRDKDRSIDREGIKAVTFQALWYMVTIAAGVMYYQWMFDQIENMSTVSPGLVTGMFKQGVWVVLALLLINLGFIFWSAFGKDLRGRRR